MISCFPLTSRTGTHILDDRNDKVRNVLRADQLTPATQEIAQVAEAVSE